VLCSIDEAVSEKEKLPLGETFFSLLETFLYREEAFFSLKATSLLQREAFFSHEATFLL